MPFSARDYISRVGCDLVGRFDTSGLATTPSLKGANREKHIRDALSGLISPCISVSQGVIISNDGSCSSQQDVVLFEKEYGSVFSLFGDEANSYFPCETTLATIEIKSVLNPETLRDMIKKSTSVKKLRRKTIEKISQFSGALCHPFRKFGSPISHLGTPEEDFSQDHKESDQILCLGLAGKRDISETMIKSILTASLMDPNATPPDGIVTLDGTVICWARPDENYFWLTSLFADGVYLSEGNSETFGFMLAKIKDFSMQARTVPLSTLSAYYGPARELLGRRL